MPYHQGLNFFQKNNLAKHPIVLYNYAKTRLAKHPIVLYNHTKIGKILRAVLE